MAECALLLQSVADRTWDQEEQIEVEGCTITSCGEGVSRGNVGSRGIRFLEAKQRPRETPAGKVTLLQHKPIHGHNTFAPPNKHDNL